MRATEDLPRLVPKGRTALTTRGASCDSRVQTAWPAGRTEPGGSDECAARERVVARMEF